MMNKVSRWDDSLAKEDRVVCECTFEQVKEVILEEVRGGTREFVIYPYGKYGKIAREILDQVKGISYIVIDEKLSDEKNEICRLNDLGKKKYFGYTILLCSNSLKYYNILRGALVNSRINNRIIDVCLQKSLFSMLQFKEPRISALECVAREIYMNQIEGNVAEAGVFQGDFARYINIFFPDRKLYLIDTFEGFDQRDVKVDVSNLLSSGNQDWSDTNVQLVLSKMKYPDNCVVKKGYFPGIMENEKERQYCFVSLDMDLYQPIYEGLHYFYPKLNHGGYIFIHDCRNLYYRGSRKAVADFCKEMNISYMPLQDYWGSVVIVK